MKTVEQIIMDAATRHTEAQHAVNDIFEENRFVLDEVALLFPRPAKAWAFIEEAVKLDGVELFNVAEDKVKTFPIRRDYRVKYFFLSTPFGFRLECMNIFHGISPLHNGFVGFNGETEDCTPPVVHFSFKCQTDEEYAMALKTMKGNEWHHTQSCFSDYGQFSYWLTSEATDDRLSTDGRLWREEGYEAYIKPRLNTRDRVSEAAMEYLESKA